MKKIFVSGANGFIGKALIQELKKRNINFVPGSRTLYGEIEKVLDWNVFLKDCDTVIHLAGRVHIMNETVINPLEAFREINVKATIKFAESAKKKGIKKFIYISSIKVNGEETFDYPFKASDTPNPSDPYSISKMEAERELRKLHEENKFEVVIIRPPLVYGPEVKANFEKLFWLVNKNFPLPFSSINNRRSIVSVLNLVDLIINCVSNPMAGGHIFLVSDGRDYSLKDLLLEIAATQKKDLCLLPASVSAMKFFLKLIGKNSFSNRLFGNLHVDISETKSLLNWEPKYTFQETYSIEHIVSFEEFEICNKK